MSRSNGIGAASVGAGATPSYSSLNAGSERSICAAAVIAGARRSGAGVRAMPTSNWPMVRWPSTAGTAMKTVIVMTTSTSIVSHQPLPLRVKMASPTRIPRLKTWSISLIRACSMGLKRGLPSVVGRMVNRSWSVTIATVVGHATVARSKAMAGRWRQKPRRCP